MAADAADLPLMAGQAGVVCCLNLLDVTSEPAQLMEVQCKLVANGGCLVIASPWCWHQGAARRAEWFTEREAQSLLHIYAQLEIRGFSVLNTVAQVPWTLILSRSSARLFASDIVVATVRTETMNNDTWVRILMERSQPAGEHAMRFYSIARGRSLERGGECIVPICSWETGSQL